MQANLFSMQLEQVYDIAPAVKHFVLRPDGKAPFSYVPGQFITVHFEHEGKPYKRSYSIANAPKQDGCIEFAASFVEGGVGSGYLFSCKPGDSLAVSGPYGRLVLKENLPGRYVLVGTGTGVTPYRAMIPQLQVLLTAQPKLEVVILQGVRTQADLLYAAEFRAFAQANPRVRFYACISRHVEGDLATDESLGYVQTVFPSLSLAPQNDLVYLCGNPGMIDEAFSLLTAQGFAVQHVVREKYISR